MSALDYLLTALDPFTLFGLERAFEIDPILLEQRYAQLSEQVKSLSADDPVKAKQVLGKLAEGRRVLSNPVGRADHLLDLLGGKGDAVTDGLPPGFHEKLDMVRRIKSDHEVAKERERMLAVVGRLFRFLDSADNGVVMRERRRQIREALNAITQLDHL